MPGHVSVADLVDRFHLREALRGRFWHVLGCSATTRRDELLEGLEWLSDAISDLDSFKHRAAEKQLREYGDPKPMDCIIL